VKALNGVGFSEFNGHENWQDVAVSQTDEGIKAILGNPIMIKAYTEGVSGNGKFSFGILSASVSGLETRQRFDLVVSQYS
jgi:hypothetical protein